jgi:hypothetical protein
MEADEIKSNEDLRTWLEGKPTDWAHVIAARIALRVMPWITFDSRSWLQANALHVVRSNVVSWAACNYTSQNFDRAALDAAKVCSSAVATAKMDHEYGQPFAATYAAANAALAVALDANSHGAAGLVFDAVSQIHAGTIFWQTVQRDCVWIARQKPSSAPRALARKALWMDRDSGSTTGNLTVLLEIDSNYAVWLVWYERRIRGERSAFDIPGDEGRKEDKAILRRLAEATDEGFWGKGHEYVNATLKGWLDEARERSATNLLPKVVEASGTVSAGAVSTARVERVTSIETPPQEANAIAYGVNEQGKLDRLPNSDQVHLRDVPDQRRAYNDLRAAAAELLDEGQRLGHRLQRALDRFLNSLPDGFEDAEAYLVWRDANALRRLHRAHREASKSPEPDEARLEPVVAEGLGGLLDLYNNFAFADDGLRAKDEARVAPQERASAEAEAKAAIPLVEAILANPAIATPAALDDIVADAENAELPADDPYTDQVLDQANRTKRNWIAGLLSFGKRALEEAGKSGKEIRSGAERAVGALIVSDLTGVTSVASPLIEFIAAHASALKDYAAIAYSSFPSLSELIDRIKALLSQLRN